MNRPKSAECRCEHNFTCAHCLRNAPPYHYTLSDGSALPPPADLTQPGTRDKGETIVEAV